MGPIGAAAANVGLGLMLEQHNDKRQLRQQEKLSEQQFGFDIRRLEAGQKAALEQWKATGPVGQMEQLEKAGLNPALIYGHSGPGGQLSGGMPGSGGGTAAPGGGEIMGLQLIGAQKRLIEAQTKKTEAEAAKTAGIDTDVATQDYHLKEQAKMLNSMTMNDAADRIYYEAQEAKESWEQERIKTHVDRETYNAEIKTKFANLVGIGLANEQRRVQTEMTEAQMEALAVEIAQKWKSLEIQQGELNLKKFVQDISESTKLGVQTVGRIVGSLTPLKWK